MKKKTHLYIILLVLFFIGIEICTCVTALAEVKGPGWFLSSAKPASIQESEAYYQSTSTKKVARALADNSEVATGVATTITPEIAELARALQYDPKLIYDYVYNNVDYIPYFGSLKGATLTLLDKCGNDFDIASLLIALLRESGYTANYYYGTAFFSDIIFAEWAGVTSWLFEDRSAVSQLAEQVFCSGGVPFQDIGNGSYVMRRICVKLIIDETDYFFDPITSRRYSYKPKIDIGSAMGYDRAELLSAATDGATITDEYSQNFNEAVLNNKLTEYATNLVNTLRSEYPNSAVVDIIGGREIYKKYLTDYPVANYYMNTYEWTEIPEALIATLHIQHEGIDHIFQIPEIVGSRLTITYSENNFAPELRLDGALIALGNNTTEGDKNDLIITVDHPYASQDGTYADQTSTYKCVSGSTYAIVSDFAGGATNSLIRKRQKELSQSLASALPDTSEQVLGETLNIMGLTFLKEACLLKRLSAEITDALYTCHHAIGLMAQESAYYIDVKTAIYSGISKKEMRPLSYSPIETFLSSFSLVSAFEHAILEQMSYVDNPGVSTIKLMHIANNQGCKVFWANSENFANIQSQLQNYSTEMLTKIQDDINAGKTVILPENGSLTVNQWHGIGYASRYIAADRSKSSLKMAISGDYYGGFSSFEGYIDPEPVWVEVETLLPDLSCDLDVQTFVSSDPVDMATGAYLYEKTDLAMGKAASIGLELGRSYNSSRKQHLRSMGHGWQHNYDIVLSRISDSNAALGLRTPIDAVGVIVNCYITEDLMLNEDSVTGWMVMFLAHKWAVDQLIDNAISINIGGDIIEYVQLPDGTYNNPPGITTELIDNGDETFSLKERFGTEMHFDVNSRIIQLQDIDGNTLNFAYLDNRLSSVYDEVGRSLTLAYTEDNLTSVTDSEGRGVSYVYDDNNDLINYTDVTGKTWAYFYDDEHQMTSLSNPLGITTASNTYDTLGKVNTQTVPRDGVTTTYNFYFSGFYNIEEDPYGNLTVYYLDGKGRTYAIEDTLGNIALNKEFDGQNHVVNVQDVLGNNTSFTYDDNQNLTNIKNAMNKETNITYDEQFRLTDITDPLNHIKHFEYDSEHHLAQATDAINNMSVFTYYADGKVRTITDGRGTTTTNTYDSKKNPLSSVTGSHPAITYQYDAIGRMIGLTDQEGATTTFTYDSAGHLLTRTDPLGKVLTFTYDDAGRIISRADRNGDTIAYTYTPSDKLKTITYPDSSVITFNYNLHDKLVSMEGSTGATAYTYDKLYRLESLTNSQNQTISYEYDKIGNVIKIIYPDNKSVFYTYDALNRIETVTDWQSNVATYNYDDVGRLTSVTNFNGTVSNYTYDNADRLIALENKIQDPESIISSYAYILDENGNKIQIVQDEPLAPLVSEENTDLMYNAAKNRLILAGSTNFAYDDEGQLATKGVSSYTFDYEHRLKTINGSDSANFVYDGKGNRIEASRNGMITRYIYDAKGNLLAEADSNNNITRYYVYGRGLLAMVTPEGQTYTYHYNGIGSTIAITDQEKKVVNKYFYTPFGLLTSKSEDISQPFTFNGKYGVIDEQGALYYMRARYYDASIGRFISEDPIGFAGGQTNLYAYVGSNPVNFMDPWGLCAEAEQGGGFLETIGDLFFGAPVYAEEITGQEFDGSDDSLWSGAANSLTKELFKEVFGIGVGFAYEIISNVGRGAGQAFNEAEEAAGSLNFVIPSVYHPEWQKAKEDLMQIKND